MFLTLTNSFYNGLTIGIVTGILLSASKNHIFKNKWISRFFAKSVDKTSQQQSSEFKMALLVRHDLKMGKGKVAAQCSHAIVHCYKECLRSKPEAINSWEANNKPVDIFKVADEKTMLEYQQLAIKNEFSTHIVIDAGRTQVAPRSKTVMAIGPAKTEQIDLFTESLQVYS